MEHPIAAANLLRIAAQFGLPYATVHHLLHESLDEVSLRVLEVDVLTFIAECVEQDIRNGRRNLPYPPEVH